MPDLRSRADRHQNLRDVNSAFTEMKLANTSGPLAEMPAIPPANGTMVVCSYLGTSAPVLPLDQMQTCALR